MTNDPLYIRAGQAAKQKLPDLCAVNCPINCCQPVIKSFNMAVSFFKRNDHYTYGCDHIQKQINQTLAISSRDQKQPLRFEGICLLKPDVRNYSEAMMGENIRKQAGRELTKAEVEEAIKKTKSWLQESFVAVFLIFACDFYDALSSKCQNYENRPPFCRNYKCLQVSPGSNKFNLANIFYDLQINKQLRDYVINNASKDILTVIRNYFK